MAQLAAHGRSRAPVAEASREPCVFVDFNAFQLYRAAAGSYDTDDRLLQVWTGRRSGPWLSLEVTVNDNDAVLDLHQGLTAIDGGPQARAEWMLALLAEPTS